MTYVMKPHFKLKSVFKKGLFEKIHDPKMHTAMKILGIAYPKHWILLVVSKYLDENLMQIDLLVLST